MISKCLSGVYLSTCQERIIPSDGSQAEEDSTLVRSGKWKVPSSKDYLDLFKGLLDCENFKVRN